MPKGAQHAVNASPSEESAIITPRVSSRIFISRPASPFSPSRKNSVEALPSRPSLDDSPTPILPPHVEEQQKKILAQETNNKPPLLAIVFFIALYIFMSLMSTVFYKKELNAMKKYPYITSLANYFLTYFAFIACEVALQLYVKFKQCDERKRRKDDSATTFYSRVKHFMFNAHFLGIAVLDVVATLLQIIGANGMGKQSGSLMVIIGQSSIPLTVVFSFILLRERYSLIELLGATVVLAGVVLTVMPDILSFVNIGAASFSTSTLFYTLLFFLSFIPNTLMKIYEEYVFSKRPEYSAMLVGLLERTFEIPLGILFGPLYLFLDNTSININDFPAVMKKQVVDGAKCLVGISTPDMECDFAWLVVLVFNAFSFLWLAAGLAVVKYSNANLTFFANAIGLAACPILFSLKFIMGEDAGSLSLFQILGLILLIIGMLIYGIKRELRRRQMQKHTDEEEQSLLQN